MIELLEQVGTLRVLLKVYERPHYITELVRMDINPNGVASLDTLRRIRMNLVELRLITEEIEEGPRPKTFLVITPKGRRVAEKIKEIVEILEE